MSRTINRKIAATLFALAAGIFISSNAVAAGSDGPFFGKEAPGKWIIGLKAAQIDPNIDSINNADAYGLVLGYEFARPVGGNGSSTLEFEYISGDEAGIDDTFVYEADVYNAFFTYRTAGDLYLKLKAGLSYTEIDIKSLGNPDDNFEDVSFAAGIGLGYHIGDYGVVELEYQSDTGDADLGIFSVNALLEF